MSEDEKPKQLKERTWWDSFGKIFRGRQSEVPSGMDFCDNCGRIYPKEDLHHVIRVFGTNQELVLCEECSDLPPSTWRNRFGYNRKHGE